VAGPNTSKQFIVGDGNNLRTLGVVSLEFTLWRKMNDTAPLADAEALQSRRIRGQLRNTTLQPAQLRPPITDPDSAITRAVLQHPNCPEDLLISVAVDDPDYTLRSKALQRLTPLSADTAWAVLSRGRRADCDIVLLQWRDDFADASKMFTVPHTWLRSRFASSPDAEPALIVDYAFSDPSPEVRAAAVANRTFPADRLPEVLADTSAMVRRAVLRHPEVDTATVGACATDADTRTRRAAFEHEHCPASFLAAGLDDPDAELRRAAAGNWNFPGEALARAVRDPDPRVRLAAVENPQCPPEVVGIAACDPVEEVRAAAGERGYPVEALAPVVRDPDPRRRLAAAGNPQCPPEAVAIAACDPVEEVRAAAVGHRNCPVEALGAACADVSPGVRLAALRNESPAPASAVWNAWRQSRRRLQVSSVSADPSLPNTESETHAAIDAAAPRALARARWAELETLPLELLPESPLTRVIAGHLGAAAADRRVQLRLAAARHNDVDAHTLVALSCDPEEDVRRAASARLMGLF
jgi:hypothetical protein